VLRETGWEAANLLNDIVHGQFRKQMTRYWLKAGTGEEVKIDRDPSGHTIPNSFIRVAALNAGGFYEIQIFR
jgi:hypothetical protein